MARLWRKKPETKEGKYLVKRRDGTVPEWPHFVLGAKDPATPAALIAYANAAEKLGFDPEFVADIRTLAHEFEQYRLQRGNGVLRAPHRPHVGDALRRLSDRGTQLRGQRRLGSRSWRTASIES